MKRKVEALLLKPNAGTTAAALQEPTLEAVIEVYTRDEMPERAKSQQNYRLLMDRHIQPKWGDKVLSEVRPHAVEVWLRELSSSPETKRHIKSMMYRLFELAMKRGWLEAQRNPMSLVRVKGRNRVIEKVVLTPDQMLTVRENLEDRPSIPVRSIFADGAGPIAWSVLAGSRTVPGNPAAWGAGDAAFAGSGRARRPRCR